MSNFAGKKESLVCMAIQAVTTVKIEFRNRHRKSIIASRDRRVK
jgi:hypothetical protein